MSFLAVDGVIEAGVGPADRPSFVAATGALSSVAYALNFASKQRSDHPIDSPVLPLEGSVGHRVGHVLVGHGGTLAQGYQLHGRHHEIYLSDPMRTKPANLKTVLRHPVVLTS